MSQKRGRGRQPRQIKSNSFIDTVYGVFTGNPFRSLTLKQTAAALGITDRASRELVSSIIQKLVASGMLVEMKRGKYGIHPNLVNDHGGQNIITGKVDMKQTGKAYIIPDEGGEDIYIAPNNTFTALNGDKVKVHLFPGRKGRKPEGQIIEIVKRDKVQFVGIIEVQQKFAFMSPDSLSFPYDIFIPFSALNGAKNGQKVIVRITEWPSQSKNPFGEVLEVLGDPGVHEVEMHAVLAEFGFSPSFPKAVEAEARAIPDIIPGAEIGKRRDMRGIFTCTIDPADAKDFDDALSLRKLENGAWEVGIHIADVSHYVKPGTRLDDEAQERGTSVYLVDRTVPMLPEKLSNEVCSLRPDEDKLTFSVIVKMDDKANVLDEWMGKTVIRSDRRYHYGEVQSMIEGAEGDNKEPLMILHGLASKLREERFSKGSINFNSKEVKFELDKDGKPLRAFIKEQKEANHLIEEFMLLANRKVAEHIGRKRGQEPVKTFVYRIHDEPNPEKLQTFATFVGKLGYRLSMQSRKGLATSLNNLFHQVEGKGEESMIESIAIRTMAKAEYSVDNIGHYGLAFRYYTHFTSPIRRYPDLLVHRLLFSYLNGGKSANTREYEQMCRHSSDMEKKAQDAERASVKYKQAEYMLDKVGQEFSGLISGVSKWGIYVELEDSFAEGMVSLRSMNDDYYYLDDENYQVIGQRSGRTYRLGDNVRIVVRSVDLHKKQMDFLLA